MKRKVQAQRKFAQGALLPAPPEKRLEVIQNQPKPIPNNVVKHQSSARILLDLVTFNKLHGHQMKIPVIVLERMPTDLKKVKETKPGIRKNKKTKAAPKTPPQKHFQRCNVYNYTSSDTSSDECLVPMVTKRPPGLRRPSLLKRKSFDLSTSEPKKRRETRSTSKTHSHQNSPSKKETTMNSNRKAARTRNVTTEPANELRVPSGEGADVVKASSKPQTTARDQDALSDSSSIPNLWLGEDDSDILLQNPLGDVAQQNNILEAVPVPSTSQGLQANLPNGPRNHALSDNSSIRKLWLREDDSDILSQNPVGAQFSDVAQQTNILEAVPVPSTSQGLQANLPNVPRNPQLREANENIRLNTTKGKKNYFYDRDEIVSWISESQPSQNKPATSTYLDATRNSMPMPTPNPTPTPTPTPTPIPLPTPIPTHIPTNVHEPEFRVMPPPPPPSETEGSVCPSEQLSTVRDIVVATSSEQDIGKRCKSCYHCRRVDKISKLRAIAQNTRIDPLLKPSSIAEGAVTPKDDEWFYIDVGARHNRVMQIQIDTSDKTKRRLKVVWVDRKSVAGQQQFEFTPHEMYLDEVINNLENLQASHEITPDVTPRPKDKAAQVNAPVFYPTSNEFSDPVAYFEKIMPIALKYGICKVVAPDSFKPSCHLNEQQQFDVTNQYLSRLYSRWGPGAREMCAIRAHLASQSVIFKNSPLIDGVEVNLPKLNHVVQRHGGLKAVIEKKKWGKVAEEMKFNQRRNIAKKLDSVYVRYLLPYGTLSTKERHQLTGDVEREWQKKNAKLLDRALRPLHEQRQMLGESDSSGEELEEGGYSVFLEKAEDCITLGRKMNLTTFKKIATSFMQTYFPEGSPASEAVEKEYWKIVLLAIDHVCVNGASIDTGREGYGFTKNKNEPFGKHPWNLKVLSTNPGNVLRALGPVLGLTVPTLHVGMLFSTSCWHSDPQGLPWVEYLHSGASKIWYGIPEEESHNFRRAVETLCPTSCQNKSIWLPSDITMIPPNILCENMVSLSRVEQNPGEFVIVCPKAYSCSISTGYSVSESVYFAPSSWLNSVHGIFQVLRDSCEPTMFALEQLLFALARDTKTPLSVLLQVYSNLQDVINDELNNRAELRSKRIKVENKTRRKGSGAWNVRDAEECRICGSTLYMSLVSGIIPKKVSVCLVHARRLLETPKHRRVDCRKLTLSLYYSDETLKEILRMSEEKILARPGPSGM